MNKNRWEDRNNDWLAQEMRREGYTNNRSNLEWDHHLEEQSRDWNAGAISNAKEHEERHQRFVRREQVNNGFDSKVFSLIIYIAFIILFFVFFILSR